MFLLKNILYKHIRLHFAFFERLYREPIRMFASLNIRLDKFGCQFSVNNTDSVAGIFNVWSLKTSELAIYLQIKFL